MLRFLSPFVQHYSLHFSLHQVVQSAPTQKPRKPRLIWKYAQADCDSARAMIEATDWDVHFVPSDSTPLLKEQKDLIEKQNREEQHAHHPCTIPVSTNHPLHPHETITVSSERCRDSPVLSTRCYPASARDEFTAECSELTSSPPPPYDEVVNITAVWDVPGLHYCMYFLSSYVYMYTPAIFDIALSMSMILYAQKSQSQWHN